MRIVIITLLVCCFGCFKAQHNSTYSQYLFNGLLLNPAYAGSQEALNITSLYRKQWLGWDGAPTNINLTAHMPLKKKKSALGLVLLNDKYGVSDLTKLHFNYAYRIKMSVGHLALGLLAGIDVQQYNWNQIRTTQLRDPSFTGNAERRVMPQAGVGMYYFSRKFYAGISAPALISAETGLNTYQLVIMNMGYVMNVGADFKLKPAVLMKYLLNSPLDLNLSTTLYWKEYLGLGVGYSLNKSAFVLTDIRINDQFRLGYAYDYSFTLLNRYMSGSHEIMLRYLFQYKIKAQSMRYF